MKINKNKIILLLFVLAIAGVYFYFQQPKSNPGSVHNNPAQEQPAGPTSVVLKPAEVSFSSDKKFSLNIPQNYQISLAAQGFRRARFMALSPDGRLFLGEMTSASDTSTGRVYVLDNFDETSGTFKSQKVYLNNLRNPNSLAFYTNSAGTSWLYIALTDKLIRYKYNSGDTSPTGDPEVLATFPDYPHNPPEGYWHITRTVVIHNNQVYVSIGSSCDSCQENEDLRAVIVKMDVDGKNQQILASGLRNAVGLAFSGNDLFATVNGSDDLGKDKPEDPLYKIVPGTNYGWPYCYQFQNKIYPNTTKSWSKPFDCSTVPLAWATFLAHSAPLGLEYFDKDFADPLIRDSFLAALHGSGDIKINHGNAVVVIKQNQPPTDFITGFLQQGKRLGRPVDVLVKNKNSFFVTDDLNGVIYYLNYFK